MSNRPGEVRDAIVATLKGGESMTVAEICDAVSKTLGRDVPSSSVRSYLNINTPAVFRRVKRGTYRIAGR